jgi:hypothetical protein
MSHGTPEHAEAGPHGHGGAHAHGVPHGSDVSHGLGGATLAAGAHAEHGHADFPPEPAQRHITPAPEDFRNLPGPSALFWPFLWLGLAILLVAVLLAAGWPPFHSEHGAADHGVAPASR